MKSWLQQGGTVLLLPWLVEGGAELEFFINAKAYAALPAEFQAIVDAATTVAARDMTARYDAFNPIALKRLVAAKTQLRPSPRRSWTLATRPRWKLCRARSQSPEFKTIHQDMRAFQRDQLLWARYSELRFDNYMTGVKL